MKTDFEKTVILATHQVHFASQADKILILENGRQIFFGTYTELNEQGFSNYLGSISQAEGSEVVIEAKIEQIPEEIKIGVKDTKSLLVEETAVGSVPFNIYWQYLMLGFRK